MKIYQVAVLATVAIVIIAAFVPIIDDAGSESDTLDVYIIAGQSNTYATINVDASSASPVPDAGTVYYFGTSTAPTYDNSFNLSACKMYDMNDNGSNRIGGIYPALGAEYHAVTGHDVYFIDTGLSGQTIWTFLYDNTNWSHVYDIVNYGIKAISGYSNVLIKGYIWIQGEGDSSTSSTVYESRMIQLYNDYNSRLTVDLPTCYVCKVRESVSETASFAQEYLCGHYDQFVMSSVLPDTFTVDNGMVGSDDLHYTQAGCNELGADLGKNIGELNKSAMNKNSDLLNVIPVFMILAVLIWIISIIYPKRDD